MSYFVCLFFSSLDLMIKSCCNSDESTTETGGFFSPEDLNIMLCDCIQSQPSLNKKTMWFPVCPLSNWQNWLILNAEVYTTCKTNMYRKRSLVSLFVLIRDKVLLVHAKFVLMWIQTKQDLTLIIPFRWNSWLEYETTCSLYSNWWNMELNSVCTSFKNAVRHIKDNHFHGDRGGKVAQRCGRNTYN